MKLAAFLLVTNLLPVGYELDAKSWQKGARANVRVAFVTTSGKENVGMFTLARDAEPLDLQICLVASLEDEPGWDVRCGPDYTVIVFAPKGESIRSMQIRSDAWVPKYKRILALPPKEPKK